MALQSRPSVLPEWATNAALGDVVEPSAGRKQSGWTVTGGVPDIPPYEWFNWLQLNLYQWTRHISERILTGSRITLANNQVVAANLTGVTIPPADFGAFILDLHVRIDATSDRYALIQFRGVWNDGSSTWETNQTEVSTAFSGIVLSVTAGGQVQYTSENVAGFVSSRADFHCVRVPQVHT